MEAPGKGMLKVVSILYIVAGGFWALLMLLSLFLGAAVGEFVEPYLGGYFGGMGAFIGGIMFIIFLIPTAVDLVCGILGLKYCGDPSKSLFFIIVGFILGGLTLIGSLSSFNFMSILMLVMPVLFIVGGFMNKNAAAKS